MKHRVGLQAAIGGVALVIAMVVLQPGVGWAAPRLTRSTWGTAAATGGTSFTAGGALAAHAVPAAPAATAVVAPAVVTPQATCPNNTLVTGFHFLINGTVSVFFLKGNVHSGDTVQAFFTIRAGCTALMTMISHTRSLPPGQGGTEQIFDVVSGTFTAGSHSLDPLKLPPCFFETDLFAGPAVRNGSHLLVDGTQGGVGSCAEVPPPPPTTATISDSCSAGAQIVLGNHAGTKSVNFVITRSDTNAVETVTVAQGTSMTETFPLTEGATVTFTVTPAGGVAVPLTVTHDDCALPSATVVGSCTSSPVGAVVTLVAEDEPATFTIAGNGTLLQTIQVAAGATMQQAEAVPAGQTVAFVVKETIEGVTVTSASITNNCPPATVLGTVVTPPTTAPPAQVLGTTVTNAEEPAATGTLPVTGSPQLSSDLRLSAALILLGAGLAFATRRRRYLPRHSKR